MAEKISRRGVVMTAASALVAAQAVAKDAPPKGPTKVVKIMTAVRRKAGVSRADFLHAWMVVHAGMAKTVPGVLRFVVNPVEAEPGRSDVPELMEFGQVDGFAETWIDAAAMATMAKTPQAQAWYKHGAEIFGAAHNFRVEETIILDRAKHAG